METGSGPQEDTQMTSAFETTVSNIKIRFAIAGGANVHALGYTGAIAEWEARGGQVNKNALRKELNALIQREPKTAEKRADWAERVAAYKHVIGA